MSYTVYSAIVTVLNFVEHFKFHCGSLQRYMHAWSHDFDIFVSSRC